MPVETKQSELSKAEAKDLGYLARQAHVPVAEAKKVPEAQIVNPQDEFNEKLKELSKKVLELAHGGNDIRNEQITQVVKKSLKFAHLSGYNTTGVEFDPFK